MGEVQMNGESQKSFFFNNDDSINDAEMKFHFAQITIHTRNAISSFTALVAKNTILFFTFEKSTFLFSF